MAYGLLLYKQIDTPVGTQRLEIHKDGYAGSAVEIVGLQRDGISISKDSDDLAQAVTTSVLTINLNDCGEIDFSQFFTPNSTLFKVIWKTKATGSNSWETRWTGFITPDSFKENLVYRDVLTLTARDNLGRLGDYDFSLAKGQMMSVRDIVNAGLAVAGVAMTTTWATTKVATNPATILAVDGLVNTTLLQGMTWREAVELLLTGLGLTLAWNDGNHFEVRDLSQAPSSSQAAFFINQSGYRQIRPAWKNLVIDQNYGLRDNFYEGQFSEADCGGSLTFTPPVSSRWATTGTMALLNPYKGAPHPLETLYIPIAGGDAITNSISYSAIAPSMQRPIKISMKCNNSVWIWRDPADYYGYTGLDCFGSLATRMRGSMYVIERVFLRFRFNIFMTVGSTKYVMRNGWEVYNPSTIAEPYLYFVMPASLNEYGEYVALDTDNEISFYINSVPGPGTLELVIYPVAAQTKEDGNPTEMALAFTPSDTNYHKVGYGRITDIKMEVDEGISARAKNVTVNADHNMRGQVSVEVGQVPQSRGNALLYLGGLFYTDTYNTPMAAFARASGGSTYDLLELVGREYISYQNAAYNALSGSMMAESLLRFDKAVSYGGKTYRIVGASLAILSNTLNVQLLQEEASFDTTAYTVNDATTEGGSGSRGGSGGISQGAASGGDRFFTAIQDEQGETTGAKALVDLHIIQTPADEEQEEVTKNITEILRHLRLETVTDALGNLSTILVSDITFASEKNTVAGWSGGSGGGTGGGSIATLADVTLTDLADRNILRYDALSSHWVNEPLSLSLGELSDVALGTPLDGQSLVYDATAGKWKPVTVGGGGSVTVISNDATIGTALTTLGTINGTPIKAKIAAYLEISQFTASNIVTALGTTPVNRATADASGNTIKAYYAANLVYDSGTLVLKNGNNNTLSTITGANILGMLGLQTTDTIATQAWVGQQGFLTASAISDMATKTWVGQQGYLTASSISDMATKTWVGQQGYLTSAALTGYMLASDYTGNGTSVVNRAKADADGNIIKTFYAANLVVSGTDLLLKNGGNTTLSTITGANIVTVIGNNAVARATADESGNAFATAYLRKNVDDVMSANLTIGASGSTKTLMVYGSGTFSTSLSVGTDATIGGNVTIGAQTSTSTAKTLTVYGRNNSTNPALVIVGVVSSSSRYSTTIYRDASALQIVGDVFVNGNFKASGYNNAGASASDRRLKTDIRSISLREAADLLSVLKPVVFRWNQDAEHLSEGGLKGVSRGFLADEFLDVLPNAGRKMWEKYDAICYEQVIPYLVAGWQQQNLRIRILEGEISSLKDDNELMRRRLREANVLR